MSERTVKSAKPTIAKKTVAAADKPKPADKPRPAQTAKPADKPRPAETPKPADKPRPAETPKPADKSKPADKPRPGTEKAAPFRRESARAAGDQETPVDDGHEAPAKPPAAAEPAGLLQPRGLDGSTITKIWLGALAVTILLTVLLGTLYGRATGVLVLVTAAFCAVIALFWSSLRTLLGETVLQSADAFAIGAQGGEDEQKRAVLRALKDLEFERGVGKISEADYKILVAKLRARAKDLLRQLDEEGAEKRRLAEKIVEGRVATLVAKSDEDARRADATKDVEDDDDDDEASDKAGAGDKAGDDDEGGAGDESDDDKDGAGDEHDDDKDGAGDKHDDDDDKDDDDDEAEAETADARAKEKRA